MATPNKDYAQFINLLDSLVYNPSRRYLTDTDYVNYANMACLEVAMAVGGINYIDATITTVANQRDYTPNNQYRKIKYAHYVKSYGLAAEESSILEMVTQRDEDFLARASVAGASPDPSSPFITGVATDTPKFATFWQENNTLRLFDTPSRTGDTLKLWVLGIPASMGAGVTYDGDQFETNAIVFRMCQLARLKSRETGEAGWFDGQYQQAVANIQKFRSKTRQVRTLQDGRFYSTRLRSVNSAK